MIEPKDSYIYLSIYEKEVLGTDQLPKDNIKPVFMGLFGEVGSLMSTVKKHYREGDSYTRYTDAAIEEIGDTLWYFTVFLNRLNYKLENIFSSALTNSNYKNTIAASCIPEKPVILVASTEVEINLDDTLIEIGKCVSLLANPENINTENNLIKFASYFLDILKITKILFVDVISVNLKKVLSRFKKFSNEDLPNFDKEYEKHEQLPCDFEIIIKKRNNAKCYMEWNGVFIGDPLTDSHKIEDGYKFHDVFHLAHTAILHWSPTFRALIKHKRKSNSQVDEAEDGGRAIVIEEGLTAWLFSQAKEMQFFEHQTKLSYDLLKTIQEFVKGYEVEKCPLSLWEDAILQGYQVFRELHRNGEGIIIGNRASRTIRYKAFHH